MKTLAYDTRGNLKFTDMSDGVTISTEIQNMYINRVLNKLRNGEPHASIRTGNFVVIGLKYETEYQIYISENYKDTSIYVRDGDPSIEHAVAY